MSRRASFFARQHPGQRRVRFPDEIVFDECIKEADGEMVMNMLRRVSMQIDVNRINTAGMTALHQVCQHLFFKLYFPKTYMFIHFTCYLISLFKKTMINIIHFICGDSLYNDMGSRQCEEGKLSFLI